MASKTKIAACVGTLCEAFNRKPTRATFTAYEMVFASISDELLDAATLSALNANREFMPTPGQLRELAVTGGIGYDARAERAWVELDHAIGQHGVDHSVSFDDGLLNAAVRLLGDWQFCCSRSGDDYAVWLKRQFLETYKRLCMTGAAPELRQRLIGNLERENLQAFGSEGMRQYQLANPRVNIGQTIAVGTSQPVLLPPAESPKPKQIAERPSTLPMIELKKAN
jgi:uncharacterized protein DUF6475